MTIHNSRANDPASTLRMRRTAMLTTIVAIAPLCVVGVVLTAGSWWEGFVVVGGLLLSLLVLREWSLDGYTRRLILVLLVTGGAWLYGALIMSSPTGFVPFALIGALLMARLPNWRLLMTVVFALGVGLIGATILATQTFSLDRVNAYVVLPIAGTLFIAGVVSVSERSWQLVRRVERANEAEAELAIAHERMRFAGDLHDIQGHTLHVIKLKTALAQQLIDADADRAQIELAEIQLLVDDAIHKTRDLAYARHAIEFTAELENARHLCEAAGIEVQVWSDGEIGATMHPLLAHVLREATTNLLRHAEPTSVSITVSSGHVEVTNDGVLDDAEIELRGLSRLRSRIESAGGELNVGRSSERFAVAATLDAEDAQNAQPVRITNASDESR